MRLSIEGIRNRTSFETVGIRLPTYDVRAVGDKTITSPGWLHFGSGNIFRIFMGLIADDLIEAGDMDTGIVCAETFDTEIVDRIYAPYDNLTVCVTLNADGTQEKRVQASVAEAIALKKNAKQARQRLKEIFCAPSLQMVSFTITEKGYELRDPHGTYLPYIKEELDSGPDADLSSAMTLLTAMLAERYRAGAHPLALVSMDNVSENGRKLRDCICEVAGIWEQKGFFNAAEAAYIRDESMISCPWTMIDKITPRPDPSVAAKLTADGLQDMEIIVTDKRTYIAPFVNAEKPQYLVIEDNFPNGRPPLEKAGVYMTDRTTVNASERMKVTVCLNPIHSALGPYGVVLGIDRFSDVMQDETLVALGRRVGETEGMEVVEDPKIISPQAFLNEVLEERFPNPFIPDTTQRLCTDISQGLSVRFGVTIRAYCDKYGSAERLTGIGLAIAGWLRYLLGVTEEGVPYELAPDPLNDGIAQDLKSHGIIIGHPEAVENHLQPILSNENLFEIDLYRAGLGTRIERFFCEEIAAYGAVRKTLENNLF